MWLYFDQVDFINSLFHLSFFVLRAIKVQPNSCTFFYSFLPGCLRLYRFLPSPCSTVSPGMVPPGAMRIVNYSGEFHLMDVSTFYGSTRCNENSKLTLLIHLLIVVLFNYFINYSQCTFTLLNN